MKGVILAGGFGKRMRKLTSSLPKPMIKVAGKPLIEHQVELFRKYGIKELLLCLHYMPEGIMSHFNEGKRFGVKIRYSIEKEPMGTAGALKLAEDFFDDRFIVIYGDNFTTLDLEDLARFHKSNGSFATIALHKKNSSQKSSSAVILNKNLRVERFIERPDIDEADLSSKSFRLVNAGIYILEPNVLKFIPRKKFDFGYDLFPLLLKEKKKLYGYVMPDDIVYREIGTMEKLSSLWQEMGK
ncbi:nucleotidyltransferase family protein [Candidatus Woesearchaeota archaeon]|nr:nucleotidyltransferase family protein [Candidatus Woesearchaeota archaeon]